MNKFDNFDDDNISETYLIPSNLLKNKQPRIKRKSLYTMIKPINGKWIDGKYYKNVTITMYSTGDFGTFIRNAVTGEVTNDRVGSKEEKKYFKVINALGLDRLNGPLQLYYESPSQYEIHQFVLLNPDDKDEWYENR